MVVSCLHAFNSQFSQTQQVVRSASRGKRYRHPNYTYREQYLNTREANGTYFTMTTLVGARGIQKYSFRMTSTISAMAVTGWSVL